MTAYTVNIGLNFKVQQTSCEKEEVSTNKRCNNLTADRKFPGFCRSEQGEREKKTKKKDNDNNKTKSKYNRYKK